MKTATVVVGLLLSLQPLSAGAQPVYKCEENGAITYTDQACVPGAAAAELPGLIVTTPPTAAQRELAREHEARLARDRAERDAADAAWLEQHERAKAEQERARDAKPPARGSRKRSRK